VVSSAAECPSDRSVPRAPEVDQHVHPAASADATCQLAVCKLAVCKRFTTVNSFQVEGNNSKTKHQTKVHLISRQSVPMPFVAGKSCSNPCAYTAEVHRQRGTLVESKPCWQVVLLSRPSLLLRRSHSPRMSAFFSDYLRQTMPQSTNFTSGTIFAYWHRPCLR